MAVRVDAPLDKLRRLQELRAALAAADAPRVDRYYADPVAFARECIKWPPGQGLTAYQDDLLAAVPEHKRVAVRGPHGLGKTTTVALLVLWFAITREAAKRDWKIATTAGAWRQLERYLWPEIRKWARLIDWERLGIPAWNHRTELLALHIKLDYGEAFAVASDDPALIEGVHADAVLYVFDEAKSIIAGTFDAAEGAFSGAGGDAPLEAFAIAASTPGEPSGRFYDIHARRPGLEDWWVRHVTVEETIAAGRVSREWVAQRKAQWGEGSAVFANRVLGEFHSSDEDGIIPLAWVEAAMDRWRAWDEAGRPEQPGRRTVGVDVARSGSDQTVLAICDGDVVTELRRSHRQDTMATTGAVAGMCRSGRIPIVDVIGIGAGVVDRLREQRIPVVAFNASEATPAHDRSGELGFVNARAAAWWALREALEPAYGATLALPPDDVLVGDLTAPRWRVMSGGRIQVESKDDLRKRIGRSTDAGDAVIQAIWRETGTGQAFLTAWKARAAESGIEVASVARTWREIAKAKREVSRGPEGDAA